MAKTLQLRRGTTGELSSQTGAVGELFVDTTKDTVVVMDGSTAGGFPLQSELSSGTNIKTVNSTSLLGSGDLTVQSVLVSGDSIKTINGTSLLGSGDITISGGGGGTSYDQSLNTTDDVVFNTGLIGDVSIISNQISVLGAYGQTGTLDLTAQVEITGSLLLNGQAITYDQDLNTTDDVVFNSVLVGDVSIVGNQISAQTGTLAVSASTVEFDSNIDLSINNVVQGTESITDPGFNYFYIRTSPYALFTYNPDSMAGWADGSKFITGTQVTLVAENIGGSPTFVIELTSDMVWDTGDLRWEASYTLISGTIDTTEPRSPTVTIPTSTGAVANYSFDDQGTFTSPTVSTTELLINGSAPGFVTINLDGSKSIVVDTVISTTETVTDSFNTYPFYVRSEAGGVFTYSGGISASGWTGYNKFVTGTQVTLVDQAAGAVVIVLTSDMTYDNGMDSRWEASYTLISGTIGGAGSQSTAYSVTVVNSTESTVNYDFTDTGFVADAALIGEIVADSALIGDVSIIGNQISAQNAYGQAGTLVVDGDLEVTGALSIAVAPPAPTLTTETISGGMGQFRLNYGSNVFDFVTPDPSPPFDTGKFATGTQITFVASGFTFVIELTQNLYTSGFQWRATFNFISGAANWTEELYASSVSIQYMVDASPAPTNTSTVVRWAPITVDGQVYFTPLYQ